MIRIISAYLIVSGVTLGLWGVITFVQIAHFGSDLRLFFRDQMVSAELNEDAALQRKLERASEAFERQARKIMDWNGNTALFLAGVGSIQVAFGCGAFYANRPVPNNKGSSRRDSDKDHG